MQGIHLRKYGVETKIDFELYEIDGVDLRVDATDAGSDCNIMKDEGAEATCTNDFVDEGRGYSITLTATEMQAARIVLYIIDSATKVWLDKVIIIETYGHASAMHAVDLADSVRAGLTALPNAAADAAGGLPISDAGGLDLDTKLANTNEVTAARMGALTDWINGGRLDLIIDIIAADTTTDIPALIATAQSDLDIITGAAGVVIADGLLTAAKFGADCITNAKIADNAIAVENIKDAAITAAKIASNAITAAKLNADCITNAKIADNAIAVENIKDAAITAAKLAADCITAAKIAAAAINNATFAADVGSTAYATNKIALAVRKALDELNLDHLVQTASTVNQASGATSSVFITALTEATNDHYNNMTIIFTDGALAGQARRIHDYVGSTKTITVYPAFTEAPANGNAFVILPLYHRMPSAGALEITYTVKEDNEDTGDAIEGVSVWITTDESGGDVIWSGVTNSSGVLVDPIDGTTKPRLDAGTYYFWRQKSGYVFSDPDEEEFSV